MRKITESVFFYLLSGHGLSRDGGRVSDMLLVTSSVWVINWVHGDTSHDGPVLLLLGHLVESVSGLEDGLFGSASSGNESDHSSARAGQGFSGSGWELDSGLGAILGVTDDGDAGSGSASELSGISGEVLDIADDGTFGNLVHGEDVSDLESSLGAAVNVLSSVHSLSGDEVLVVQAVVIRVPELDSGQRSTTSWIVEDFPDDALDVTVTFSVVQVAEFSGGHTQVSPGLEHTSGSAFTLVSYDFTHCDSLKLILL